MNARNELIMQYAMHYRWTKSFVRGVQKSLIKNSCKHKDFPVSKKSKISFIISLALDFFLFLHNFNGLINYFFEYLLKLRFSFALPTCSCNPCFVLSVDIGVFTMVLNPNR